MNLLKSYWYTSSVLLIVPGFAKASAPTLATISNAGCHRETEMADPPMKYKAGNASVAFVTTPDANSAKKLAHSLVERNLAACVNLIPNIISIYKWEGKINEDNEYLMMIKTSSCRLDEMIKFVRENHSYSVAEVITFPIEKGNEPYLKWIQQTLADNN